MKCILSLLFFLMASQSVLAHCEIPCGIYDDDARFELIFEHVHTIEKSAKEIHKLEGKKGNSQQFVRWVMNKEDHASKIQEIVSQYFLTQRIQPNTNVENYHDVVSSFHKILVLAMKTKQSANPKEGIQALHDQVKKTQKLYQGYRKALKSKKK